MTDTAKPNRKLLTNQFKGAEYETLFSVAYPEDGTTLDEMLKPEYWAHVARDMKPWQRIEVRAADKSWMAELVVLVVKPFAVKVVVLDKFEFEAKSVAAAANIDVPEGYELKYRGKAGWSVIRLSDNEILQEKEASKAAASIWLEGFLKELAA